MALAVSPVSNPTFTGLGTVPKQTISSVGVATPGTNGFASLNGPTIHAAGPTPTVPTTDSTAALLASIAAANQKVYAPALDTSAIYNQANNNATANVNPYYTKLLNDFVGQQGTARTLQEQQTATNVKNLQDQLLQIQEANAVAGTRAGEDTTLAEDKINLGADQRQTDQGTAADEARIAEATKLAGGGVIGSGLAAKEQATTAATHATTEARQAEADQTAKNSAELSKARTFEDLATSGTIAAGSEKKGETQEAFNLNKFIVGQSADLQGKQAELEQSRQSAIASERQNQIKILVNNFVNSIANPAQRQAAIQTYGAYL